MAISAATKSKESFAHLGKSHPHRGHVQSAATREKISEALKKYNASHPAAVAARARKAAATRRRKKPSHR